MSLVYTFITNKLSILYDAINILLIDNPEPIINIVGKPIPKEVLQLKVYHLRPRKPVVYFSELNTAR